MGWAFPFTGRVKKVVFDLQPYPVDEDERALHQAVLHAHVVHGISA